MENKNTDYDEESYSNNLQNNYPVSYKKRNNKFQYRREGRFDKFGKSERYENYDKYDLKYEKSDRYSK